MTLKEWMFRILPWKDIKDCCTLWKDNGWHDCCCQHDLDYRYNPDGLTRLQSDKFLKECIEASGHPKMAQVMFLGVRVGGGFVWYKNKWLGRHKRIEK
jgi:hypothetical protein